MSPLFFGILGFLNIVAGYYMTAAMCWLVFRWFTKSADFFRWAKWLATLSVTLGVGVVTLIVFKGPDGYPDNPAYGSSHLIVWAIGLLAGLLVVDWLYRLRKKHLDR